MNNSNLPEGAASELAALDAASELDERAEAEFIIDCQAFKRSILKDRSRLMLAVSEYVKHFDCESSLAALLVDAYEGQFSPMSIKSSAEIVAGALEYALTYMPDAPKQRTTDEQAEIEASDRAERRRGES